MGVSGMNNKKVLAFGEILWDTYPDNRYIGGAPLNFAAHLARHKEEVYMLSALGNDEPGSAALKKLNQWNIHTDHVNILDGIPTGNCVVTLDSAGIPSYDLWNDVAYDRISCDNITDDYDVLYFGTLSLRGEYNFTELQKLIRTHNFSEIFVDLNIRPPHYSCDTVSYGANTATIIKISDEEMDVVAEHLGIKGYEDHTVFAQMLCDKFDNLGIIIMTLGAKGAYVLDCRSGEGYYSPSAKAEVVSTVGAGDSFSAAFLHRYMQDCNIRECADYANKIAGIVVSHTAAVPEY